MGVAVLELGIERAQSLLRGGGRFEGAHDVRPGRLRRGGGLVFRLLLDLAALVTLEERVALQLLVDEGLELDVGHLQQLDRLLQLRRHDESLALAEFEPLVQRHGAPSGVTG